MRVYSAVKTNKKKPSDPMMFRIGRFFSASSPFNLSGLSG
jgi:hypothetical protein